MSDLLRACLEQHGLADRFPTILAERYPRIAARVAELWGTPMLSAYFEELLIMDRPDRQGFPPEVGAELMTLAYAYDQIAFPAMQQEDVWAHVHDKARQELAEQGLGATVRDFHQCVSRGEHHIIGLFLRAGLSVEVRDEQEWTPLIRACFEGNATMAEALIRAGASVHAQDADGYGPLHWAALNGQEGLAQLLLSHGARVNAPNKHGFTPLIQAASRGHTKLVRLLISLGGNVNTCTAEGWTALHKAVANGHLDAAVALLDHGADPQARHQDGTTPLQIAQQSNRQRLHQLLSMAASLRQRRPESYNAAAPPQVKK
ncbi:ankyrin repeat domain-containing protein [Chitiniphilus purpureus]|uniref:Ankyrin repeat domain-containing protein n=1 Tax=Chitiniphilus purpureus TaxID=2981137 RepID=A0ABY6DS23_9NEIS|nr:ankyrin repeat domain-containing protein [Chitiniphilus sp. CD1]UXY16271.1 ankyrin repeat domain-containing protein [Chitiniphilus sp. CD1]